MEISPVYLFNIWDFLFNKTELNGTERQNKEILQTN